jgi:hypothetical protein
MRTDRRERVERIILETMGADSTRRLGAGVAAALALAIAACSPSEPAQPVAGQPRSGPSAGAPFAGLTLDVDGDGEVTSHADALLILRYTSGFRGNSLVEGAVAGGCKRCTAEQIETYLASL